MDDLPDPDRLRLIIQAFLYCEQDLDPDDIQTQFRRETNRQADPGDVQAAIARCIREEERKW